MRRTTVTWFSLLRSSAVIMKGEVVASAWLVSAGCRCASSLLFDASMMPFDILCTSHWRAPEKLHAASTAYTIDNTTVSKISSYRRCCLIVRQVLRP